MPYSLSYYNFPCKYQLFSFSLTKYRSVPLVLLLDFPWLASSCKEFVVDIPQRHICGSSKQNFTFDLLFPLILSTMSIWISIIGLILQLFQHFVKIKLFVKINSTSDRIRCSSIHRAFDIGNHYSNTWTFLIRILPPLSPKKREKMVKSISHFTLLMSIDCVFCLFYSFFYVFIPSLLFIYILIY